MLYFVCHQSAKAQGEAQDTLDIIPLEPAPLAVKLTATPHADYMRVSSAVAESKFQSCGRCLVSGGVNAHSGTISCLLPQRSPIIMPSKERRHGWGNSAVWHPR